jgi:hypothetical protein
MSVIIIALALICASCEYPGGTVRPQVENVTVTAPADVEKGKTVQFNATVTLSDGSTNAAVNWSVKKTGGDPALSTINKTGVLDVPLDEPAVSLFVFAEANGVRGYARVKLFEPVPSVPVPSITITDPWTVVSQNESVAFSAVPHNAPPGSGVVWSVSGNMNSNTKFSGDSLYITGDEVGDSRYLTVRASLQADGSIYDEVQVYIIWRPNLYLASHASRWSDWDKMLMTRAKDGTFTFSSDIDPQNVYLRFLFRDTESKNGSGFRPLENNDDVVITLGTPIDTAFLWVDATHPENECNWKFNVPEKSRYTFTFDWKTLTFTVTKIP